MQSICNKLGIALQHDAIGHHVTVVTKKIDKSDWFLTRDIPVRFPSKRLVSTAYDQQRAPVKNKGDNDSRILTHDGHNNLTIIVPSGHIGNESSEASLNTIFISFELLRGKDIGDVSTLFRDSLNDVYEDLLMHPDHDYIPPKEFIDILITFKAEADAQVDAAIMIPSTDLLYLLEFNKIHKFGGISSPYASIEWQGVQIPQALTSILTNRGLDIFLLNNDGVHDKAPHNSSNATQLVED
jgi:hypothetical protein